MKRNSDETLRRLEREYASAPESGTRFQLIKERLRLGLLTPMHVRVAAAFGDEQAIAVGLPKLKQKAESIFARSERAQAGREGWNLFNSDTYGLEIELEIDPDDLEEGREPYADDAAARADVVRRAYAGEVFAMKTILALKLANRAAYQETLAPKELHRLLDSYGIEYALYVAGLSGDDDDAEIPISVYDAGEWIERRAEEALLGSFLGLAMRSNPDEDLRQLERDAREGGLVEIERWLAARRRKDPELFRRLAAGEEPEATARLVQARIDEGRPNAGRERDWLNLVGFGPDPARIEWRLDNADDNMIKLVAAHPVLAGLLAYEIVDQDINVESNGYEVGTRNTQLVDSLMRRSGKILGANFKAGLLDPKVGGDKFLLRDRQALHAIYELGQEAIDEDLDTVIYGKVTYGDELSQFPNVAWAVILLADFVATGRPEHLRDIESVAYEMRGMEYADDSDLEEYLERWRAPVIRRVLESGPILGAPK